MILEVKLVTYIDVLLQQGILYVSKPYETSIHLCACGCGQKSVVPFSKQHGWKYTEQDGKVSLHPSIWNHHCPNNAHYYITDNEVIFC